MPALPPVPNVLKCDFHHLYGGQNAFVHWFFRYTGSAPSTTDAAAIANALKSAWQTNLAPLSPTSVTLNAVVVTDLSSPTSATNTSSGTVVGTRAGTTMTAGDAVLVNQHVNRRYRGGHPRQYWPFGITGDIAGPLSWQAAFQTAVASAINAMVSAAAAITWPGGGSMVPVNVSYYQGFTVHTDPATGRAHNASKPRATPLVDVIASSSVNPNIATQRRRLLTS